MEKFSNRNAISKLFVTFFFFFENTDKFMHNFKKSIFKNAFEILNKILKP